MPTRSLNTDNSTKLNSTLDSINTGIKELVSSSKAASESLKSIAESLALMTRCPSVMAASSVCSGLEHKGPYRASNLTFGNWWLDEHKDAVSKAMSNMLLSPTATSAT